MYFGLKVVVGLTQELSLTCRFNLCMQQYTKQIEDYKMGMALAVVRD